MRIRILHACILLCMCFSVMELAAQTMQLRGRVTSAVNQEALAGVTVAVQGSNEATSTDQFGRYVLEVAGNRAALVFTQLGMLSSRIVVTQSGVYDVQLQEGSDELEEVVVVGYGTQKKSVVTGAISSVKASDLETMPVTRIEQSLQGRTSGLTVATNSGQPGSAATIRVRGFTTFGNNNPLWVVDGVVVDAGGISYLNQSDIESIEVLKDASSQAIYGARAAAGVILVTTKKGVQGVPRINYNTFLGTSAPARKLSLLNATEYATLRNESAIAAGNTPRFSDPRSLGEGTDWQEQIFNKNAFRQNHELSVSGGNEVSTFYSSFGYLTQEGIVASEISNYRRANIRLNSEHKIAKWLTLGQNLGYSHERSQGIGNTNSEYGGPLSSAINLDPITPVIETDADILNNPEGPYLTQAVPRDAFGNPYAISTIVLQEMTNPLAYMQTRLGNHGWSDNIVGNVYGEISPIEGLKIRSTLGSKLSFWGDENFTPVHYLNSLVKRDENSFARGNHRGFDWNLENTISYTRGIEGHNMTILLGQGAYYDRRARGTNVIYSGLPVNNYEDASLNYNVPTDQRQGSGYEDPGHTVSSLFARVNYNYKEKYIAEGLIRRDGSSRFGSNNKYGVFPSFSLGWVASRENFLTDNPYINMLKIRGGYGVVGNDNIGDFAYFATISGGRNYNIGTENNIAVIGYSPNAPSNPDLKWEQTSQANIGLEATLLQRFSMTFDWYNKVTTGILQNPRIPFYVGAISNPAANVADMKNTGVELELGYNDSFGDVQLSLNGNVSYLRNEVTNIGAGVQYFNGASFQASSYPITRTMVGEAYNSFYGFQTMGIFQNEAEINAYTNSEGNLIQPNARPGDFKWADLNGDGVINENDRTFIGDPTPNWAFGLTLNVAWKNFDALIFGQGVAGNKIFQGLRRLDVNNANYSTRALGRWTGEGSSYDFPRLTDNDGNNNFTNPSNFYLEDGSYFRFKTVQLGYTLPRDWTQRISLQKARIYVMAENLLTFTRYSGFDPEIGGDVMSIDRGIYPQARSFMFGLNVAF
ncbi:SusC/RagA family TonB-linked outer membrane protein [Sphingobacterium chuzhouense]|uniref:TonB-dependent receptor n=1 Tax=Sphingobacterium chuzhouense TaxID=1742264 RepID=A0ABR7XMN4_9SPHI|nr:TonB-dependent receptor [Sphingobacterium chuzhouense]MBD1420433.1 TonB-dependent receptor [Sphingobacterium chuzhouense]